MIASGVGPATATRVSNLVQAHDARGAGLEVVQPRPRLEDSQVVPRSPANELGQIEPGGPAPAGAEIHAQSTAAQLLATGHLKGAECAKSILELKLELGFLTQTPLSYHLPIKRSHPP